MLIAGPDLIVLDEPADALDPSGVIALPVSRAVQGAAKLLVTLAWVLLTAQP